MVRTHAAQFGESRSDNALVSVQRLDPVTAATLRDAPFSYEGVGATRGDRPVGYHHVVRSRVITGETLTELAVRLFSWQVHERAGVRVAASADARPGTVVSLRIGLGPVSLTAPCRVVYTIREATRAGFAYGTLPGHPESGEELFLLAASGDRVVFSISAFSVPAIALTRAAGALGRAGQRLITRRYLDAITM